MACLPSGMLPRRSGQPELDRDASIQVNVNVFVEGKVSADGVKLPQDGFAATFAGTPSECLRRLEYDTLAHFGARAFLGFQLLLNTMGGEDVMLVADHLKESHFWRATVSVKVRFASRLNRHRTLQHGRWIHDKAAAIQREWRRYSRWRRWVEVEDILCTFGLDIARLGLREWNPAKLFESTCAEEDREEEAKLVRLAVISIASASWSPEATPEQSGVFEWAEQRSAAHVMESAADFAGRLSGLALDRWPSCRSTLGLLIQDLLRQLSEAFPFLMEPGVQQRLEERAAAAATAVQRRCGSCSSDAFHSSAQTAVQSAVLAHVLRLVRGAIWEMAYLFHDLDLHERVRAASRGGKVTSMLQRLTPSRNRPQQLLLLKPKGLPHVGEEEVMLLPAWQSENLGVVLQASCLFYGVDCARLSAVVEERVGGPDTRPLLVETLVGELAGTEGFLTLQVEAHSPKPGSFDLALQGVVQAVGSQFSLDRSLQVLKLKLGDSSGHAPLSLGDTLVLPDTYPSDHLDAGRGRRCFHFYDSRRRRMKSVRCSLQCFLGALREECMRLDGVPKARLPPFGGPRRHGSPHLQTAEAEPQAILGAMQGLQRTLDHWLLRPFAGGDGPSVDRFAASSSRGSSRRGCSLEPWDLLQGALLGAQSALLDGAAAMSSALQPSAQRRGDGDSAAGPAHAAGGGARSDPEVEREEERKRTVAVDFLFWSDEGAEARGPSVQREQGESASRLARRPESVMPVVAVAAAASAPLVLWEPVTRWSLVQTQELVDNNAVLPSQWGGMLPHASTLLSGGLAGATIGSMLGPVGAAAGAAAGAFVTEGARGILLKIPETVSLPNHSYLFPGPGKMYGLDDQRMYLMHESTVRPQIGAGGMVYAALLQASLRGISNLSAYVEGDMSGRDIAVCGLTDCRDGAGMYALNSAILSCLTFVEQHSSGMLHVMAGVALNHPTPVMMVVMGTVLSAVQCVHSSLSTSEELWSNLVMSGSSTAAGVTTTVVATIVGVPELFQVPLAVFASRVAGAAGYEAWRRARRRELQRRLRDSALDVMGLAPYCTKEQVLQRFRVLGRMAHPDRNKSENALEMFKLLGVCRDVLLADPCADANEAAFSTLARRLRRASWSLMDLVSGA